MDSPLLPPEGTSPDNTLTLAQGNWFQTFVLQQQDKKFVLFKPPNFLYIFFYGIHGKLIQQVSQIVWYLALERSQV